MLIRMILTLGEASATCGGRSERDVVIGELRIHIAGVLLIPQLWFEGRGFLKLCFSQKLTGEAS